jgi:hypothetical protein
MVSSHLRNRGSRNIPNSHLRNRGSRNIPNSSHIPGIRNNRHFRVCRRNNFLIQPNRMHPLAIRPRFRVYHRNNRHFQGKPGNRDNLDSQGNQGNPLHGGVLSV